MGQGTTSQTSTTTGRADGSRGNAELALLMALEIGVGALWVLWDQVGVDLTVAQGEHDITVSLTAAVIVATLVAVAAMGLLRALSGRPHGRRTWTIIAAVVWAVSFAGPLGATTPAAGLALASFHVLVGATLLFGLRRLHPDTATDH
ncbi:MAG: DUF6069 family protein [Nocardioidaceae bacterium]